MEFYKILFRISLVIVIIYPNFYFFKRLKTSKKKYFKHQLIYFLISFIVPCAVIFLVALIMTTPGLLRFLKFNFDLDSVITRIIIGSIIFPPSILINIYFAKFYLKRISKTKKDKEIELIGKE